MEMPDFSQWLGRQQAAEDVVAARLVQEFEATLAPHLAASGTDAPQLIHWCLAPPAVAQEGLGEDGHPAKGGFLPPIPLPRRMWASGEVQFLDGLRVGDTVTRTSTIARIEQKTGRSGDLWFVDVGHEIATGRGPAIRETQSLVFRAEQGKAAAAPQPSIPDGNATAIAFPTVRLFRYSSLTFNGHRIHYDFPYATGVEGYEGLVVHGPLQATLLAHAAAKLAGKPLRSFRFRGVSPLIAGQDAAIRLAADGDAMRCAMCHSGGMTMEATAGF
jgi:3-methylfumaryl-CoA hydratase